MRGFMAGLLATIALVALAAAAGAQGTPSAQPTQSTAAKTVLIDPKAKALLARADANLFRLKTYSADFIWDSRRAVAGSKPTEARVAGSVRLMKPNYSFSEGWIETQNSPTASWQKGKPAQVFASDGKTVYHWLADTDLYDTKPADHSGANINPGFMIPLHPFFVGTRSLAELLAGEEKDDQSLVVRLAKQNWSGRPYQVVEIDSTNTFGSRFYHNTEAFYIGGDSLVHHISLSLNTTGDHSTFSIDLSHIAVDRPMTAAAFAYKPPASALNPPPPTLLAQGAEAPDFTVHDSAGKPVRLSDYKGKIVVLDFWATWCGPCQQSLPETNQVAQQYRDKGVVFLAVNVWDKQGAFDSWLPKHKDYDALVFAIDPSRLGADVASVLYRVGGIPTQYVIGRDGKVAASFVGYPQPSGSLENALKAAGAS